MQGPSTGGSFRSPRLQGQSEHRPSEGGERSGENWRKEPGKTGDRRGQGSAEHPRGQGCKVFCESLRSYQCEGSQTKTCGRCGPEVSVNRWLDCPSRSAEQSRGRRLPTGRGKGPKRTGPSKNYSTKLPKSRQTLPLEPRATRNTPFASR